MEVATRVRAHDGRLHAAALVDEVPAAAVHVSQRADVTVRALEQHEDELAIVEDPPAQLTHGDLMLSIDARHEEDAVGHVDHRKDGFSNSAGGSSLVWSPSMHSVSRKSRTAPCFGGTARPYQKRAADSS